MSEYNEAAFLSLISKKNKKKEDDQKWKALLSHVKCKYPYLKVETAASLPEHNKLLVRFYNERYNVYAECIVTWSQDNRPNYPFKTVCDTLCLIKKHSQKLCIDKVDLDILLFDKLTKLSKKRRKREKEGMYATGFTKDGSYVFLDSDKYDIDNENLFVFLPCDNKISLAQAYSVVKKFIHENPSTLPVFLYSILAFSEELINDKMHKPFGSHNENPFNYRNFNKYYSTASYKDSDYSIIFSLWLHGDKYTVTKEIANIFSNVFLVDDIRKIRNTRQLHINIKSKNLDIDGYKTFFKDIPILVYSNHVLKYGSSKIVNNIINSRWSYDLNFSPVFVSSNTSNNVKVLDLYVESDALYFKSEELYVKSKEIFDNLKNCVNIIYCHFIRYILKLMRAEISGIEYKHVNDFEYSINKLLYRNFTPTSFFDKSYEYISKKCKKQQESADVSDVQPCRKIDAFMHRAAYIYKLTIAAYAFDAFLISNDIADKSWLRESEAILSRLILKKKLVKKKTNMPEQDISTLIGHLNEIIKLHSNDIPQETVWLEKHKIDADNSCLVYSFNSNIVTDIMKYKLHSNSPLQVKRALVKKHYMFKQENDRYVFDKNANGKKYRVYRFKASLFSDE